MPRLPLAAGSGLFTRPSLLLLFFFFFASSNHFHLSAAQPTTSPGSLASRPSLSLSPIPARSIDLTPSESVGVGSGQTPDGLQDGNAHLWLGLVLGSVPSRNNDLAVSLIYFFAYLVLLPVVLYRLLRRTTLLVSVLIPTAFFIVGRTCTFALRAWMSNNDVDTSRVVSEHILLLLLTPFLIDPFLHLLSFHALQSPLAPDAAVHGAWVTPVSRVLRLANFVAFVLLVPAAVQFAAFFLGLDQDLQDWGTGDAVNATNAPFGHSVKGQMVNLVARSPHRLTSRWGSDWNDTSYPYADENTSNLYLIAAAPHPLLVLPLLSALITLLLLCFTLFILLFASSSLRLPRQPSIHLLTGLSLLAANYVYRTAWAWQGVNDLQDSSYAWPVRGQWEVGVGVGPDGGRQGILWDDLRFCGRNLFGKPVVFYLLFALSEWLACLLLLSAHAPQEVQSAADPPEEDAPKEGGGGGGGGGDGGGSEGGEDGGEGEKAA